LLAAGSREVELFLTSLAVEGRVAAATQNQAMNAFNTVCYYSSKS